MRVEAINSTALSVQWQPPADDQLNGVIRGYQIHYSRSSHDDQQDVAGPRAGIYDTMNGSFYSAAVVGLHPETEYRVHVTAYTRRGDGMPSRVKRVRTKGAGLLVVLFIQYI